MKIIVHAQYRERPPTCCWEAYDARELVGQEFDGTTITFALDNAWIIDDSGTTRALMLALAVDDGNSPVAYSPAKAKARALHSLQGWFGPDHPVSLFVEGEDEPEPSVEVPAERLRHLLLSVQGVMLDGADADPYVVALANDVATLNDCLPEEQQIPRLREWLGELLVEEAHEVEVREALGHCRHCGNEIAAHPSGLCSSCEQQARYDRHADAAAADAERADAAAAEEHWERKTEAGNR